MCVDGLATRVQRPGGWANQKVLYDAKRRTHTAQGVALPTIHGDLLWCDGGWPGSCHEHELLKVSGVRAVLDATGVTALVDREFRGMAKARALARADRGPTHQRPAHAGRTRPQPPPGRAARPGGAGDRASGQRLDAAALAWPAVPVRDVYRAAAALICLGRWIHRIPT